MKDTSLISIGAEGHLVLKCILRIFVNASLRTGYKAEDVKVILKGDLLDELALSIDINTDEYMYHVEQLIKNYINEEE